MEPEQSGLLAPQQAAKKCRSRSGWLLAQPLMTRHYSAASDSLLRMELIVRLAKDADIVWSNTLDAPTSPVMGRAAMRDTLTSRPGTGHEQAAQLLDVADEFGTSDPAIDIDTLLRENRAGPGESPLTVEQILVAYRS